MGTDRPLKTVILSTFKMYALHSKWIKTKLKYNLHGDILYGMQVNMRVQKSCTNYKQWHLMNDFLIIIGMNVVWKENCSMTHIKSWVRRDGWASCSQRWIMHARVCWLMQYAGNPTLCPSILKYLTIQHSNIILIKLTKIFVS